MSEAGDQRLQRLLGGDKLAPLRRRLRRRFERTPMGKPVEQLRVAGLTADEHATLASLIGRPQRFSGSLSIDVGLVDAALREAGVAASLRDALERLDGPIADLAAARLRSQELWSSVIESSNHPDLAGLLRAPSNVGLLKRLARQDPAAAARLCRQAEAVLNRLPATGLARSQLAAEVLGDAHALDDGRPVATLVLAVLRRPAPPEQNDDAPMAPGDDGYPQPTAERARDIWATAGILVNELARPALFLNLPVKGSDYRDRGEPAYASLRSLLRSPSCWDVLGRDVQVCENPNLVAIAADRLGPRCAPLVCTDGMPAAAQRCLLSQLARAGARLRYHGDFDWPGVHIANHVMREHGARAWQFETVDYLAAIQAASARHRSLEGKPVEASWDKALTAAMQQHRTPIAEESVAAWLLRDLEQR